MFLWWFSDIKNLRFRAWSLVRFAVSWREAGDTQREGEMNFDFVRPLDAGRRAPSPLNAVIA